MNIRFLVAAGSLVLCTATPAFAQDTTEITACVLQAQKDNGLSSTDLGRLQAGGSVRMFGRTHLIGRGDLLGDVCSRAIMLEREFVQSRSHVAEAERKLSEMTTRADQAEHTLKVRDDSFVYKFRFATGIFTVFMLGWLCLRFVLRYIRRKNKSVRHAKNLGVKRRAAWPDFRG
jgi:hypothetical protein